MEFRGRTLVKLDKAGIRVGARRKYLYVDPNLVAAVEPYHSSTSTASRILLFGGGALEAKGTPEDVLKLLGLKVSIRG